MLRRIMVSTSNFVAITTSKLKDRKGMEMLQMVMMLAIAVVLATLFYTAFKGNLNSFMNTLNTKMGNLFK